MVANAGLEESKSSQQQPCLLLIDPEKFSIQTDMFNNNKPQLVYDLGGEIPGFVGRYIGCAFDEWVLLTGTTDDLLVNLLSKEVIELPSSDIPCNFCTLTSHPYDPTCHIVYFSIQENALMFCRPGDKEFTIQKWDYEFFPYGVHAIVAGKLCLYLHSSRPLKNLTVGIIEFKESTYQLEVVEMGYKLRYPYLYLESTFLFEYSGDLFVVLQISGSRYFEDVIGFEILKADFLNKKLVSVKNLGRVAIFIGYETAHVQCASVESGIAAYSILIYI